MRTIPVLSKDLGFWTQTEVTVTKKEDGIIVWCNHADTDFEQESKYQVSVTEYCNKCEAYRDVHDPDWINAPSEGCHVS